MEGRNIYKSIVMGAILCLLFAFMAGQAKQMLRERKTYEFTIQANSDLTGDIVAEFEKMLGIHSFEPMETANVTIRLNQYSMDATLVGLDLDSRRLQWKAVEPQIALGNTPVLFFGADIFSAFTDQHGYTPEKSQIEKWMKEYRELELTITDEDNCTKKAKICGILEQPNDQICIDRGQLRESFGNSAHILGGYLEIFGYQNAKEAQKLLEGAGFVITGHVHIKAAL